MSEPFQVVDGRTLSAAHRRLLRPCEAMPDAAGLIHYLPRFFYEIPTWAEAKARPLAEHFTFAELLAVDCREADGVLHTLPHYVPCAVAVLGRFLQAFRERVGAPVFIAVNGGYRSPAHAHTRHATPHLWAAAANIYRIGDTFLDGEKDLEKYGRLAESVAPGVFVKPFGHGPGESDDHLHVDLGYVTCVPRGCDEAR